MKRLSCFERSNMPTIWTSFSVVLLSVSVQIGLASVSSHGCNTPLGLQDRRVSDSQLSSTHYYEHFYIGNGRTLHTKPECARLYNWCAWCAAGRRGYYIEVDLKKNTTITGIATQGFLGLSDYYVRTYRVVYSSDGREWQQFRTSSSRNAREKIWPGNSDVHTVVKNTFTSPISARFVRVYPLSYKYEICMRMELYGCRNDTTVTSTTPTTVATTVPTVSEKQRTSTSSAIPSPHETTSSQGSETTNEKTTVILTTPAATVPTTSERQRITNANIPSPHLTTTSSEGQLCEIATSHNIRSPVSCNAAKKIKPPTGMSCETCKSGRVITKGTAAVTCHQNKDPIHAQDNFIAATVPTEKMDSLEEEHPHMGEYRSSRNTLVIGLTVGVAFLLICSVPVVMLFILKCHQRQKSYISKYQVNSDVYYGIPLANVVYDAGLCKQELDEYHPAFEEYNSNGTSHRGPHPV